MWQSCSTGIFIITCRGSDHPTETCSNGLLTRLRRWFSLSISSRIMLWTDGRGSFQRGWPRMSLGCHIRPVSSVRTVLLGIFPQVSSVASDVGPLVCSDVVGPRFSAVPCDFTRYPGLACSVQDPDVLSFVERSETLACMSVIVGLHRRLSAIQMLTLRNSDGRWRGRKQCGDRPAHQHLCRWWQIVVDWGRSKGEHGKV